MTIVKQSEREVSRVTRSKAEARQSYDLLSRWYDLLAEPSERGLREIGLRMLAVKNGETVLEIGFGTGHGILALARAVGDSGKVYGIDISPRMREITEARVRQAGLSSRVDLTIGDATTLPYQNDFFDAIFISFTLELFDTPDIPVVLRECRRVLRPNGRMGVVGLSKTGGTGRMTRLYEWAHQKIPRYLDCRPIFVQQSLEDAGFHIVDVVHASTWGLAVEIVLARKDG